MSSLHPQVPCVVRSGPHSDVKRMAAKACTLQYLGRREKLPSVSRCLMVNYGNGLSMWAKIRATSLAIWLSWQTCMRFVRKSDAGAWRLQIATYIYTQCEKACVVTRLAALNYCLFKCLHWHWEANLVFAFTILKCRRKKPYKTSSVYSFPVYIHLASRWGAGDVGTHGGRCAILCVLLWGVLQLVRRLSFWVAWRAWLLVRDTLRQQ